MKKTFPAFALVLACAASTSIVANGHVQTRPSIRSTIVLTQDRVASAPSSNFAGKNEGRKTAPLRLVNPEKVREATGLIAAPTAFEPAPHRQPL
jgi:hypothetical protein